MPSLLRADALKRSVPGRVVRKFIEDRAPRQAVLIAWSTLLAIFPIILAAASILGFALRSAGISTSHLYGDFLSVIPDPQARRDILDPLAQKSGVLALVAFFGLLVSGSALFGTMEEAFALVYHAQPRSFLRQKLLSFAMIVVFAVLAGLMVGAASVLPLLNRLPFIPAFLTHGDFVALGLQVGAGILDGFVLFLVIYHVVPNRPQRFRQVWPGALLAGALLEAVTLGFPTYLKLNHGINAYGSTFGLFFLLMTYTYFVGLVTMLGVEVNSVLYPVPVAQPAAAVEVAGGSPRARPGRRRSATRRRPANS